MSPRDIPSAATIRGYAYSNNPEVTIPQLIRDPKLSTRTLGFRVFRRHFQAAP